MEYRPVLNFDPYRWNAEHGPAKVRSNVSRLATLAALPAENEKSKSGERPAKVANAANPVVRQPPKPSPIGVPGYGGDPASPYYVLDDDGWIGESPRQTRLRLIQGGRGEE
jgi:hypothetical protein